MSEESLPENEKFAHLSIFACREGYVISRIATSGGIAPEDAWAFSEFGEAVHALTELLKETKNDDSRYLAWR